MAEEHPKPQGVLPPSDGRESQVVAVVPAYGSEGSRGTAVTDVTLVSD